MQPSDEDPLIWFKAAEHDNSAFWVDFFSPVKLNWISETIKVVKISEFNIYAV